MSEAHLSDDPVSLLYTTRQYPCGCRAEGTGDVPAYCSEHGLPPELQDPLKVMERGRFLASYIDDARRYRWLREKFYRETDSAGDRFGDSVRWWTAWYDDKAHATVDQAIDFERSKESADGVFGLTCFRFPFWRSVNAVRRAYRAAFDSSVHLVTYEELWKVTEPLDEHPDDWEHPCMCATCRSYADE